MNSKLILGLGVFVLTVIACVVGYLLWQTEYRAQHAAAFVNGEFVSTYVPKGWKVTENDAVATIVNSPDYALQDPAVIANCTGTAPDGGASEGCAMNAAEKVVGKGAYFALAYDPCLYTEDEVAFRQREQRNYASSTDLVEQKPIVIAGRKAVLFHNRFLTNTAHPAMEDVYSFTVPVSGKDCQDVNFGFVESSTTNYGTEYQRFIDGLEFVSGKSFH